VPEYEEVIEEGKNDSIEESSPEENTLESSDFDKLFPKTSPSVINSLIIEATFRQHILWSHC